MTSGDEPEVGGGGVMRGEVPLHKRPAEKALRVTRTRKMGRLPALVLLLMLLSVFCFSAGEKDRGFHVGHVVQKLSTSEPSQEGSRLCHCPGSQRLQKQKHGHRCPCDGFAVPQSGRHRRHSHHKNKHLPHHKKHKCQSNCQHRHLLKGLQIPL